MATYDALITTFTSILQGLKLYQKTVIREQDKLTEALKAIYFAASETETYLADLNSTTRNRERERALSKMWVEAGVSLRTIDTSLAERCITKSEYWSNPDSWTSQQIKDARIKLRAMKDHARILLFK